MLAQSNTNTQCNANSQSYRHTYTYFNADSYAEIYSVAEGAPHAASAPVKRRSVEWSKWDERHRR